MTQKIINIGSSPNDGNGDPLRIAMDKINQNFSDIYYRISGEGGGITPVGDDIILNPGSTGSVIVNGNTSAPAMRVTQIGSGHSFLVEDSASTDNTPFVVTSSGNVGIGLIPTDKLHVSGNGIYVGDVTAYTFTSMTPTGAPPFRVTSSTVVSNLNAYSATSFINGTSNIFAVAGNVSISTNGTENVLVVRSTGANIAGYANITGNVNVGNLGTSGTITTGSISNGNSNVRIFANANVTISAIGNANVLTVSGPGVAVVGYLTVTANVNVGNIAATGSFIGSTISNGNSNIVINSNGNINLSVGGTSNVLAITTSGIITPAILNGNSNVKIAANANVTISAVGNANILTVTGTGAVITGTANVVGNANITGTAIIAGNVNVANIGVSAQLVSTLATGTAPLIVTSTTQVANLNVATSSSVVNGNSNIQITANSNITVSAIGNANVLTVTGAGLIVGGYISRGAPVTKSTDFTIGITENWIICTGTGGQTTTVTFPSASTYVGREITIKAATARTVISASSNIIPINNTSAGTAILDGTAGKWATLVSDGTNWVIMATG